MHIVIKKNNKNKYINYFLIYFVFSDLKLCERKKEIFLNVNSFWNKQFFDTKNTKKRIPIVKTIFYFYVSNLLYFILL